MLALHSVLAVLGIPLGVISLSASSPAPTPPGAPVKALSQPPIPTLSSQELVANADHLIDFSTPLAVEGPNDPVNPFLKRRPPSATHAAISVVANGLLLGTAADRGAMSINDQILSVGDSLGSLVVTAIDPSGFEIQCGSLRSHLPYSDSPFRIILR